MLTTTLSEDYIDPSVLITDTDNNNTLMTYLYATNYFYIFPFDELENSHDTFEYINHYASYRINSEIGYLTEKFNLLLKNYSFTISDINYAGRNLKELLIPDLVDS